MALSNVAEFAGSKSACGSACSAGDKYDTCLNHYEILKGWDAYETVFCFSVAYYRLL